MRASETRQRLEDIRSRLREAVDLAEIGDNPLTWMEIARCLGHVCASLRLLGDAVDMDAADHRVGDALAQARSDLRGLMIEALTLAYAIGEDHAALELGKALICLSAANAAVALAASR